MPDNAGVFCDYFENWVYLPIVPSALLAYNGRHLTASGQGIFIVFVICWPQLRESGEKHACGNDIHTGGWQHSESLSAQNISASFNRSLDAASLRPNQALSFLFQRGSRMDRRAYTTPFHRETDATEGVGLLGF
jgi:hypothetical protein